MDVPKSFENPASNISYNQPLASSYCTVGGPILDRPEENVIRFLKRREMTHGWSLRRVLDGYRTLWLIQYKRLTTVLKILSLLINIES